MEKLLLELRGSLQTEYKWVPTNTMITLYKEPGTTDPSHAWEYDLSCLIGHKIRKENTVYHENNVGFPDIHVDVYVHVNVYVYVHVHVDVYVYIFSNFL